MSGKVHLRCEKSIYAVQSLSTREKVYLRVEMSIYERKSSSMVGKVYHSVEKAVRDVKFLISDVKSGLIKNLL